MNRRTALKAAGLGALALARIGRAARCTTNLDPRVVHEYERYLSVADDARAARFEARELSWIADLSVGNAENELRAGKSVRRNIGLGATNERLADLNGTVIHWIGAIQINGAGVDDLKAVLQDYRRYPEIFNPLIYECWAQPVVTPAGSAYDVAFGLQNVYKVASFFPQHYSFLIKSRSTYSDRNSKTGPALAVHWRAHEIRESQSGVPGRNDFLNADQTHGVLWAFQYILAGAAERAESVCGIRVDHAGAVGPEFLVQNRNRSGTESYRGERHGIAAGGIAGFDAGGYEDGMRAQDREALRVASPAKLC